MEGEEVWVAETWGPHGEGQWMLGVFSSREAAFDALRDQPNMTVYVGEDGWVHGRPRREHSFSWPPAKPWVPVKWGQARPMMIRGRAPISAGTKTEDSAAP